MVSKVFRMKAKGSLILEPSCYALQTKTFSFDWIELGWTRPGSMALMDGEDGVSQLVGYLSSILLSTS